MSVGDQAREGFLRFAIDFVNMNLDQLRRGDWLNLIEDLTRCAGYRKRYTYEGAVANARTFGMAPWPVSGSWSPPVDRETYLQLQFDARTFIHGSLDRKEYQDALQRGERSTPPPDSDIPELRVKLWLEWPESMEQLAALFADADLPNLVLLRLAFVLGRHASHLKRCPECRTIFYRVRKQKYCSRRCTNRANMREWRKTPKGQAREPDLNHRRYQARVKRTSPKAKVARRPRATQPTQGG